MWACNLAPEELYLGILIRCVRGVIEHGWGGEEPSDLYFYVLEVYLCMLLIIRDMQKNLNVRKEI